MRGGFKLKLLLVHHSENLHVFKKNNTRNKLNGTNSKTWVNRQLFIEWIHEVSAPSVKKDLRTNSRHSGRVLQWTSSCPRAGLEAELGGHGVIAAGVSPPDAAPAPGPAGHC